MENKDNVKDIENKSRSGNVLKTALIVVAALIFATLSFGAGYGVSRLSLNEDIETINYILDMYRKYYYDEQEDVVGIFSDALLDEYSKYYTAEENAQVKASYAGSRVRIGCSFENAAKVGGGTELKVKEIDGNAPCQQAGL